MNERESILILNSIPGLGNARVRGLIDRFGSPAGVLAQSPRELAREKSISFELAQSIASFSKDGYLERECRFIEKNRVRVMTFHDADYPSRLKEIPDAPVVLFVKGELPEEIDFSIAVVGSRQASVYGLTTAQKFSCDLAQMGMVVVSGLARGIDTAAHRGALKARGKTIAVLGCGLAHVYPSENKKLFEEIAESGAIISEFSSQVPPATFNFPRRNRIISGLSLGVIVVEASLKSGALITADFALEQGREVFAVPGKVDNPTAQGTHKLIKQGAKLVSSVDDVLEELKNDLKEELLKRKSLLFPAPVQRNFKTPGGLSAQEVTVVECVADEPVHIDNISSKSGLKESLVGAILLQLELKRIVKQLPGKMFVRNNI